MVFKKKKENTCKVTVTNLLNWKGVGVFSY